MRNRRIIRLGVIGIVLMLIPAVLIAAKCGFIAHWVDTCSADVDSIPDTDAFVHVTIVAGPMTGQTVRAQLVGPLEVSRSNPLDDSVNYPGTRPVDGHLDVIDTEIISMDLTSFYPDEPQLRLIAGAGEGNGPGAPLAASLGNIAELSGDPYRADSFFDVYFEVELVGTGLYLYNHVTPDPSPEPLRLEATIDRVPPKDKFKNYGPAIDLYDSPVGGTKYATLTLTTSEVPGHWVNVPTPATSHIGLMVASLLLLSVGVVLILRRRRSATA